MGIAEVHIIKCAFIVKTIIKHLRLRSVLRVCSNFFTTSLIKMCSIEIYSVISGYLCFPQFVFTSRVLTLCLPALRFTVKVCRSYSVYLYNFSVYLYVLISIMWEISKLQLLEISSWEIFFDFLNLAITDHILFIFISKFNYCNSYILVWWYVEKKNFLRRAFCTPSRRYYALKLNKIFKLKCW